MDNFVELALRTESSALVLKTDATNRLLHAAIGLTTESGEFIDALKKHLFYNKPLDLVNLRGEIGDILWYLAIAIDALDTSFPEEMERVINKLRVRYPDVYDDEAAQTRDLFAERKALEK